MKTASNKKIMRLTLLVFAWVLAISAYAQEPNNPKIAYEYNGDFNEASIDFGLRITSTSSSGGHTHHGDYLITLSQRNTNEVYHFSLWSGYNGPYVYHLERISGKANSDQAFLIENTSTSFNMEIRLNGVQNDWHKISVIELTPPRGGTINFQRIDPSEYATGTKVNVVTGLSAINANELGIGTSDPFQKLTVIDGQIYLGTTNTNRVESGRIRFGEYTNKFQGAFVHYDGSTNFLNVGVHNTNDTDASKDVNAISIKRETGHVAMGTTDMSYQLNVGGDLYFPEESGSSGRILFRAHSSDIASIKTEQFGTGTGTRMRFEVRDDTDDYFSFNHGHHQNGNVEIFKMTRSKVTSAVNMDVDGIVRSKEVKVELENWPDYVFTPSYNLQSLSEVESFINQNGHLPNIPSAAEVEENKGIELGEMNAKLLEKIEELTLHLIEKDKEISELKETNKDLANNQEKILELLNQLKENKSTKSE